MTKKIIAIFSSVLLLAGSALPVLAQSTVTISGNGSDTNNVANVTVTQTTQVSQTNTADITNTVNASADTGDNDANHNTGGSVSVDTGNANTDVTISNTANTNVADVDNCNCGSGDVEVLVSGNGDDSNNTANTTLQNTVTLGQTNVANVTNNVEKARSDTGDNDANHNTGGSVSVSTGNATTSVDLSTNANANLARVGNPTGLGGNSTASVIISGNGSDSQNTVNLGLTDWIVLGQTNVGAVTNSVSARSDTGDNDANHNTGGSVLGADVTIDTGNAKTEVSADTAVNFNEASIGCDCLMGVTAKISGNGASGLHDTTISTINATLVNGQQVGQVNAGRGIFNGLYGRSESGDNDAYLNTGNATDPSIMTGDATSTTDVTNQGNANIFGSVSNPFPWWHGSSTNVTLTFSLHDLLLALGIN